MSLSLSVSDPSASQTLTGFRLNESGNNTESLPFIQPFVDLKIPVTVSTDATLIMFESLNNIDYIMATTNFAKYPQCRYIFAISGSDEFANKARIAQILPQNIIPKTFSSTQNLDPKKIFIAKQNVQRQEGLTIFKGEDAATIKPGSYVVIQELLQDPYIYNKRKINLRIYLLVKITPQQKNQLIQFYYYNDGFIYYTAEHWVPNSPKIGPNITTGYIDRQVYVENPLTIQDMLKFVPQLKNSIHKTMTTIATSYRNNAHFVEVNQRVKNATKWTVFGVDLAPNSDASICLVIEMNKGCSLEYKDERDKALKFNMIKEAVNIVTKNSSPENFIEI